MTMPRRTSSPGARSANLDAKAGLDAKSNRRRAPRLIRLQPTVLALALALALGLPRLAAAQVATPGIGGSPSMGGAGASGSGPAGSNADDKPVLAPALPGSVSTTDSIAPPSRPAAEMSPNDALFDAIERGDLAGARDALARGARLDARDVLGETPLELSIDLGRNPITFTLLSMRGAASDTAEGDAQPPPPVPTRSASTAGKPGDKPLSGGQRIVAAQQIAYHGVPIASAASDAGSTAFAGTPDLAMGFLGFSVPR
uniref:Ankyrin repeat domain-containing protein n=1 Tax=Acidicaldus sp. TaxID=1872105 RepID=A0A8J4M7L7_9PROT